MSSAGAKALNYWKEMEKKTMGDAPKFNFKISKRRTNMLRRKFKHSGTKKEKEPVKPSPGETAKEIKVDEPPKPKDKPEQDKKKMAPALEKVTEQDPALDKQATAANSTAGTAAAAAAASAATTTAQDKEESTPSKETTSSTAIEKTATEPTNKHTEAAQLLKESSNNEAETTGDDDAPKVEIPTNDETVNKTAEGKKGGGDAPKEQKQQAEAKVTAPQERAIDPNLASTPVETSTAAATAAADTNAEEKKEEEKEPETPSDECPFPCVVKYDFSSVEETELSVKSGESVIILQISETGWCLAQRSESEEEGWVPMDYLDRIEDEKLEKKTMEESKVNIAGKEKAATPDEPQRSSPLGEENQKLFEYLTTSKLFQKARSQGEMKVQIEDLHLTLEAGGGLSSTLAMMRWLDMNKFQFPDFSSLQNKLEEMRAAWSEHRLVLKMRMKWGDEEATRVMEEALGGVETLEMLKGYEGDPEGAIQKITAHLEAKKETEKQGRAAVLDYLSTAEALDAMFQGKSPAEVLEKVKALNAEKLSLDTFEQLVEAVSGKKIKSVKKANENCSFQPVLEYLSSPQCDLFSTGLRVSSSAITTLLDAYNTNVERLLIDVSVLNALGVKLQSFSELAPALEGKNVLDYKKELFNVIKNPEATHFAKRPPEFSEDELYGVLALSTSRITFLPTILKNLPKAANGLDDLCDIVGDIISQAASAFAITVPLVQKLIYTSQFSKWGLQGGSVEDILKALYEAKSVFDSFEGLIDAVDAKADRMGTAVSAASQ
eukprot:jgi/Bigna1/133803/aug1.22_g8511